MGKMVATHQGRNGTVHVVDVFISRKTYWHPTHKLAYLPTRGTTGRMLRPESLLKMKKLILQDLDSVCLFIKYFTVFTLIMCPHS